MLYLISYDISVDKVRNKLAKLLEGKGKRVQYSVFECQLTTQQYKVLYQQILPIVNHDPDGNVRIYKLCAYCANQVVTIGKDDFTTDVFEDVFII